MTAPEKTSLHVAADAKTLPAIFRAIRPHQWAKNVLVFVPILFSHSYGDPTVLLAGLLAFISFSLCASSVYLVNDMVDIEADRRHPTKRNRPFASGELSLKRGILWAGALGLGSLGYAFALLGPMFGAIMCAYLVLTTAYTFWLKQFSTADVVALSLLYTVRILAGAAAISVVPSPWLLSYSLFFFLSLAYMKRYIELQGLGIESVDTKLPSRNYYASDVHLVQIFGIANGALSVLTLAQYVNSQVGKQVYNAPFLLWFVVPLMMFWTYRTWTWASRGKVSDDPVVFALKDRISRICVGLIICTVALARFASFSWAGL